MTRIFAEQYSSAGIFFIEFEPVISGQMFEQDNLEPGGIFLIHARWAGFDWMGWNFIFILKIWNRFSK